MKGFIIPVFVHSSIEDMHNERMGIESSLEDADIVDFTFYQITAISPYLENGETYTSIAAGNLQCISPLTMDELKSILEDEE